MPARSFLSLNKSYIANVNVPETARKIFRFLVFFFLFLFVRVLLSVSIFIFIPLHVHIFGPRDETISLPWSTDLISAHEIQEFWSNYILKFLIILNISIAKKWKFINSIRDKSCLFLVVLISRDCFYLQMMRKSLSWNRFILVFYLVSDHPFSTHPKIFLKQHLVYPPFKRVNTSNLMTFECCFLIS